MPRGFNPYKRKRTFGVSQQIKKARVARAVRMTRISRGPYRSYGFYGPALRGPQERKVIDFPNTTTAVNTTGSVTLINPVSTGSDFTNRIGRRINMTSIALRGLLSNDTVGPTEPQNCRIMLIQDLQTNGVIATIAEIFQAAQANSFMNLNNREKFKVIMDKQICLGRFNATAGATLSPTPGCEIINEYRKVNIPVFFEGPNADIGSISSGAIYLVTLGNSAAGVGDSNFTWSSRIRFVDA